MSKGSGDVLEETLAVFDRTGAKGEPLTTREVTERLDCTRRATYDRLQRLVDREILDTKEVGARGRVWWRPSLDGVPTRSQAAETRPAGADSTDGALSRIQFESLVDAVTEYALFLLDAEGRIVSWNAGAERIKRYEAEEIVGKHLSVFYTVEERESGVPQRNLVDAAREGSIEDEGWRVRKDGSTFRARVTLTALTDDSGNLDGYVKVTRDMTRQYRYEERLARQRDELRRELDEVFERIDHGFFAVDDEFRLTYLNDRAAELFEADDDDGVPLGEPPWDVLTALDGDWLHDRFERALATQASLDAERYVEPSGLWVEITVFPSETGLSVYVRDVTARRERERRLERYETVVRTVTDGVYVLDDQYRFEVVNEAYAEMMGFDRADLVGAHISDIVGDRTVDIGEQRRRELVSSEDGHGSAETEVTTADGETITVESRYARLPADEGGFEGTVGVIRDVTDRKERERKLEARIRQQEAVTELGRLALECHDIDRLMGHSAELVAETLDTDYCKVLDLDADGDELLLREGVGWEDGAVGEATVSATDDDSQAAHTLRTEQPIVVDDLDGDERFDGPGLLTAHDVTSGISTVVGSFDDPWGILGTHDTEHRTFTEHDVNFVQSVAHILSAAIDRHEYEHELERRREQLAALNDLSGVIRDLTGAVIEQSTRDEVERIVCDRLTDAGAYQFAWIGEVDRSLDAVRLETTSGRGEMEGAELSLDGDATVGYSEMVDAAVRSQSVQVRRSAVSGEWTSDPPTDYDRDVDAFRSSLAETEVQSFAAIPIVHEEMLFGVLTVATDRPDAFWGDERAIIDNLGETVGHAIASIERKRALMSDEVIELRFRGTDLSAMFDVPLEIDGEISFENTVEVESGRYVAYGTVTDDAVEALRSIAETDPHWKELTVQRRERGENTFELRLSEPPVTSTIAAHGGEIVESRIVDGTIRLGFHLPPGADVRAISDVVEETYPGIDLVTRRQISRVEPDVESVVHEELTDRQRTALEASYWAGFFEWPRLSSGEEVAETLDVSSSTFHQHLRAAERKLFETILA